MSYEFHHRDCLTHPGNNVDLVFCDPPYGHQAIDTYYGVGDTLQGFLNFMRLRLEHIKTMLAPAANLLLHADHKAIHYLKVMMDEVFGIENFRNEIIWCYSSPSVASRHLPRKHQTILWYGMGDYVFNPERVPYKALHVGGKSSWAQTRVTEAEKQKYLDRGKVLPDWWDDIPYLCRNEGEKTGYQTQKPLALMKRIVKMFSNEGQTVLDPFMGSGTTVVAAHELGRHGIGIDISAEAIKIAQGRIQEDMFG